MLSTLRSCLAILLLGAAALAADQPADQVPAGAPHAWNGKARHLIIAVIDGPRWSETWGEPTRQYIPHMATELLPQGTLYTRFRNSAWTYTNCGHAALTTGYYEQIENSGKELPAKPSMFQLYRAATGAPAEDTWVVTSKDKLFILGDSKDPAWKGRLQPRLDCGVPARGPISGYRDDRDTVKVVLKVLAEHHPALMLINLREPDSSGHAKNWTGYLQGIRDNDANVATLWQAIQADPKLKDSTDLFITNDHGRHLDGHADGYVSHGDDCEGCHQISLLALGPDIAPGRVIATERNQCDLAVTVAHLAGITLPGTSGHVMSELLAPAEVPSAPAPSAVPAPAPAP